MFEWIDSNEATRKWKQTGEQSIEHRFHYYNDAPLNDTHHTCRARWRIENETFNTLKNQGYHFEHTMVMATRIW
nr:hypothetical protein [methane-oxidizing endosymbiont of Gigantopelta aegis]